MSYSYSTVTAIYNFHNLQVKFANSKKCSMAHLISSTLCCIPSSVRLKDTLPLCGNVEMAHSEVSVTDNMKRARIEWKSERANESKDMANWRVVPLFVSLLVQRAINGDSGECVYFGCIHDLY